MELIRDLLDFFLHLDVHLQAIVGEYGGWTYAILFLIIFAETGLVVTPFLPGDSLLFAAGALAAGGAMNPFALFVLLGGAAVLGDTVNYWAGSAIGPRVFKPNARVLKTEYLERTQRFYDKYGGKTIVIARFVPIVRTYAPFVAGACRMHYGRFIAYNVIGGLVWVALFTFGGYLFGNIPIVKNNFTLVILAIIALSLVPPVLEWVRHRRTNPASNPSI
ncbi:MAG TPA: DedA family protein [Rhodothermales bacterium]